MEQDASQDLVPFRAKSQEPRAGVSESWLAEIQHTLFEGLLTWREVPPTMPRMVAERPTLKDLIEQAQAGDHRALEELVNLHEPMLVRWARRRLGYPLRTLEDTRDVIHDCYAVVLRKISEFKYEDSRSFARWLRGIVTRIVLQKANGLHVKRRLALPEEPTFQDLSSTPSTTAALRELTLVRYRELRRAERLDRLIYRLRLRGFSSEQIAMYTGMTDRGVRLRFAKTDARIRLHMRRYLEERGVADVE